MKTAHHPSVVPSLGGLVLTGVVLLSLAAASYGASFLALGRLAVPLSLGIAISKALIVLFVFMEFGRLSSSAKLAAGAALLMLLLLLGLMVADVATRALPPLPPPPLGSNRNASALAPLVLANRACLRLEKSAGRSLRATSPRAATGQLQT